MTSLQDPQELFIDEDLAIGPAQELLLRGKVTFIEHSTCPNIIYVQEQDMQDVEDILRRSGVEFQWMSED